MGKNFYIKKSRLRELKSFMEGTDIIFKHNPIEVTGRFFITLNIGLDDSRLKLLFDKWDIEDTKLSILQRFINLFR
jgi:hypothetical protein